jgi:hypothetical protein
LERWFSITSEVVAGDSEKGDIEKAARVKELASPGRANPSFADNPVSWADYSAADPDLHLSFTDLSRLGVELTSV